MEGGLTPHESDAGTPAPGAARQSFFGRITRTLNIVGTLLILAMALAVNADVVGRNVFNHPLPGVVEFLGLSIVAIVFLQMANTLREGRHVSNDLLTQLIASSRPRLKAAIYALFNAAGAVLMVLIAIYLWPILVQNYTGAYYRGTTGLIEIPIWPFMAAILLGAVTTATQFLLIAVDHIRRAR